MKTNDIPVIELSGTPRERGRCYGETVTSLIANVVEAWRNNLGSFSSDKAGTHHEHPDAYLEAFFSQTNYLHSIQQWAPALLEEVRGIAEGAGQDFQMLLGLQLLDEEWLFGLRYGLERPTEKCTAFGLPNQANGVSFAGQNMDIPSWVEGNQVLLRVMPYTNVTDQEETPEALVFTHAGGIALNGLNASALGVTCNTLLQLNYTTDGLPMSFIIRSLLAHHDINKAEQFLRSITPAMGQNLILSSPDDIRCFECCGTSVVRYAPEGSQGRIFHTNHPLVSQDENAVLAQAINQLGKSTTNARLASISGRLGDPAQPIDIDDIKEALSAEDDPDCPVCRCIDPASAGDSMGYTAGASIYELGTRPRLHLAAGPPSETEFEVFEFSNVNESVKTHMVKESLS